MDAELLVSAQSLHHVDVVGPPLASYSQQSRDGYGLETFVLDWEAEQARCPQGHLSVHWRPGHDVSGDAVIRIRFDRAPCRACEVRALCTWAKDAPVNSQCGLKRNMRRSKPPARGNRRRSSGQYALRAAR